MQKNQLQDQVVILLYGYPGSGKSFFARQASDLLGIPHISSDRIRYELFEKPTYSKDETNLIYNLMNIMLEEFLKSGMSVIYDVSLNRAIDRKNMRDYLKKMNAKPVLVWLQADRDTSLARTKSRDRRRADDKYSSELSDDQFKYIEQSMQQPTNEDVLVISGKHLFDSQKHALLRKLRELQVLTQADAHAHGVPKPELVNLVNNARVAAGRVDPNRRNVVIS